jgi:DNA repair protein RecN (Recombination protein N)
LSQEEKRALAEREFLQFQLDELLEAKFIEGEQENLEAELNTLTHAEDIKSLSRATLNILNESDFAAIQTLSEIRNNLQQIGKIYPQAESFAVRVESALIELQELSRDLERIEENVDLDPSRLDWVQQRITILYRLLKKHQVENLDALLVIQEELKKQTSRFDSLEGERAALEIECSNMLAELDKKAKMLNQKRQSIAPELEKNVQNALSKLNMAQAKMQIEIKTGVLQRSGKDEVRFLFSTNKGSAFLPMKDIASGGELSRIALCIKSLVAKALSLPTMIFDEIDTGVSGQVALQMGHMLKSLAENQQVIVITHTPQVAARANQHLVVYKTETADQQESRVIEIEAEDRIKHIAIMLSTNPPSTSAIANARELVSLTQN